MLRFPLRRPNAYAVCPRIHATHSACFYQLGSVKASPCGICGGTSSAVTDYFPISVLFPCQRPWTVVQRLFFFYQQRRSVILAADGIVK